MGESCDFIFLVVRGAVAERSESHLGDSIKKLLAESSRSHYVEAGGMAGLENIMPQFAKRTIANICSASDSICSVIELEAEPLRNIVLRDSLMVQKLWGFVQNRYILFYPKLVPELKDYGYRHIKKFMNENSAVYCLESGQTFKNKGGFILWQGQVTVYG